MTLRAIIAPYLLGLLACTSSAWLDKPATTPTTPIEPTTVTEAEPSPSPTTVAEPSPPPPGASDNPKAKLTEAEKVLALVNHYRALAGVPAVQLDVAASKGCMEHAQYMLRNRDTAAMVGLAAHEQDPSLPGASPAGAACGKAADLFPGVSDLGTAVDGWMASLYHRRPMLGPGLQRIGVGFARIPDGTLMAALMFLDGDKSAPGWPVAYPARDQTGVPLEFGNEIPNPIPNQGTGGYPITLQFPPFDKVTGVRVTLVDDAKRAIPFHLSTPEQPATSFGQYGVICVIPQQMLRPETRYSVSITATWKTTAVAKTWSFTTVALRHVDATDEAGLVAALGQPSLVRGTVFHGGMMDTETAFLQIGESEGTHYTLVSVLIPIGVWNTLAPKAAPVSWTGKTIDVEATPQVAQGKYLNLPIALASQLHVVK